MRQAQLGACERAAGPGATPGDHGAMEAGTEVRELAACGGVVPEKVVSDCFGWSVGGEDIGVGGEGPQRADSVF